MPSWILHPVTWRKMSSLHRRSIALAEELLSPWKGPIVGEEMEALAKKISADYTRDFSLEIEPKTGT
jgi:hypothetical protein